MAKKDKAFNVTVKPTGKAPDLPAREGEKRDAVRHYHLRAKSPADARKAVEEQEQRIVKQNGGTAWKVASVSAA
jgi:hypothetical protein